MKRLELIAYKVLLFSWIFMINSVIVYELVLLLQRPLCVLCRTYGCQHAPALSTEFIMQEAVGLRRHVGYFVFFMFRTHVGGLQTYLSKRALAFGSAAWAFNVFFSQWQKSSNSRLSNIPHCIIWCFLRDLLLGRTWPGETHKASCCLDLISGMWCSSLQCSFPWYSKRSWLGIITKGLVGCLYVRVERL